MPLMHIHLGGSTLPSDLRRFRSSLQEAMELASYLRGVMDNMNDAANFSRIEDEFGIAPQFETVEGQQVRITDTRCNGYKVLAWIGDVDNLFKSNAGDASQPEHKANERLLKIVNFLA